VKCEINDLIDYGLANANTNLDNIFLSHPSAVIFCILSLLFLKYAFLVHVDGYGFYAFTTHSVGGDIKFSDYHLFGDILLPLSLEWLEQSH